ncbi:hypothetical protein TNCV_4848411 [Trichonephila clavipes]|nr:hypothetical protein TNCV_4848411 [Trichonephila clavipes]
MEAFYKAQDLLTLQLDSEIRRTQFGSIPLGVPSGAPFQNPPKEYLFQLELLQPCSKEDPVTLQTKRTGNNGNTLSR